MKRYFNTWLIFTVSGLVWIFVDGSLEMVIVKIHFILIIFGWMGLIMVAIFKAKFLLDPIINPITINPKAKGDEVDIQEAEEAVDQDELCEYCDLNIIPSECRERIFVCEGRWCEEAKKMFIESKDESVEN